MNCFCGAAMQLLPSRYSPEHHYYRCVKYPVCDGSIGAHPDGTPMGIPADAATRDARKLAHRAFDQLWLSKRFKRAKAYEWLAKQLNLPVEKAHIAMFDLDTCLRVITLVDVEVNGAE